MRTAMTWYVYIIRASDDSLYTGVTTDVERRFREHSGTARTAKFFRGRQPLEVVYTEEHPDRSSALKREAAIRKLGREGKLALLGEVQKPPGRPC
jgi:putative endonuclease